MELAIVGSKGIPESAIISIRAGATRRQAKLADVDRPFKFPSLAGSDTLKVDVFTQIGSARAICPEDGTFELQMESMEAASGAQTEGTLAPMQVQFKMSRTQQASMSGTSPVKKEVYKDAEQYLEQQNMLSFLQYIVQGLIKEKPSDAYSFVAKQFVAYSGSKDTPEKGSSTDPEEIAALRREVQDLKGLLEAKDAEFKDKESECGRLAQENASLKASLRPGSDMEMQEAHLDSEFAVRELAREALTKGAQTGELLKALTLTRLEEGAQAPAPTSAELERLRLAAQAAFSRGALNGRLEEALHRRGRSKESALGSSRSDEQPKAEGLLAELQQLPVGSDHEEDHKAVKAMAEENRRLVQQVQAMRTRIESVRPETEALRGKLYELQATSVEAAA